MYELKASQPNSYFPAPTDKLSQAELYEMMRQKMGFGMKKIIKRAKDQKELEGPIRQIQEMDTIHRRDFDQITNENYELAQQPHETGNFGVETNENDKPMTEIDSQPKIAPEGEKIASASTRETLAKFLQR